MSARKRIEQSARVAFERLPDEPRTAARAAFDHVRGIGQVKRNQAILARRLAALEAEVVNLRDAEASGPPAVADHPTDHRFPNGVSSRICTQEQFAEPWYDLWCARLDETPKTDRKQWEHAYIARVAEELDLLGPGQRGLGFGVGEEPLVAYFASRDAEVVATDLDPNDDGARVWRNTGQHAAASLDLRRPNVCDDDRFDKLVSWQPADMRAIPSSLGGFDFCWSSCCFEHLGSLEAGLDFVTHSLDTLHPGGVAIHTTEFNVTSNDETVEDGPVVLYRRRDLEGLVAKLETAGHEVAALDLEPGTGLLDEYADVPPFLSLIHI